MGFKESRLPFQFLLGAFEFGDSSAQFQQSDDLADTVDYGALAQTAADVVGGRSYRLLEALSGRLASALLIVDPRLEAVEVTVRKLRPPLALDVGSTGVRVRRAR